jgi:hypothetical protein
MTGAWRFTASPGHATKGRRREQQNQETRRNVGVTHRISFLDTVLAKTLAGNGDSRKWIAIY